MSKGENIVKLIKGQRISWLGHLERMEEERMPKKIFTEELEGTRRGRPRKRLKEEVERDLHVLGVRRWTELVADRRKWKDIVRHSGLHCQWKKKNKVEIPYGRFEDNLPVPSSRQRRYDLEITRMRAHFFS